MTLSIQRKRLFRALLTTAAVVAVAPASAAVAQWGAGGSTAAAATGGIEASRLLSSVDPLGTLNRLEQLGNTAGAEPPEYFTQEIGLVGGAHDVRVAANETVVGYLVDLPAAQALDAVRREMLRRSWTEVPLGSLDGATFVKADGSCTWTLATCTQTGTSTCVVFRSAIA